MTEMASLVLFATDPATTATFYRAVGLDLEDEDHGEGPVHFATELGPVHFAIYPAEAPGVAAERRSGGSVFPGFYVESLDQAAQSLAQANATMLTGHEQMPWGCRLVAEDPDGRAVEINQRGHCPAAVR
ncbi:MAG TPA: VOC family protein [Streptosporangiaceae bacterium]|jgi:predicted enzyme related to lactoylglutathione lyase